MKKYNFAKLLISVFFSLAMPFLCWAQGSLKEIEVSYNKLYQLDNGYSIIYDNPENFAKLNEFKIEFYGLEHVKIGETKIKFYPLEGTTESYVLGEPIIGFSAVKFIVISLHNGDILDFPSDVNSVLALNELSDYIEKSPILEPVIEDVNPPPIANDAHIEVEASFNSINRSIAGSYSDLDGDSVTVTEKTKNGPPLTFILGSNGGLVIDAPSITGSYSFPYTVNDTKFASASAQFTVQVTMPQSLKAELESYSLLHEKLALQISDIENKISNSPTVTNELITSRDSLLEDTKALSKKAGGPKFSNEKIEVDQLAETLGKSKSEPTKEKLLEDIEDLKTQFSSLNQQLLNIQTNSTQDNIDIGVFKTSLTQVKNQYQDIQHKTNITPIPKILTTAQLAVWENEYTQLKALILPTNDSKLAWWLMGALTVLLAVLLIFRRIDPKNFLNIRKNTQRSERARPRRAPPAGVIFPNSPLQAANVAAPLSPAGQLTASNLQMLNGPYTALRPAYNATGRIGFAQEGVPSLEDYSFGTGFLISPTHVMTNRHVHGFYGHYLIGDDPGGIEFIAEKEKDASDFIPFNGEPPLLIPGLDIAIFTLLRPAADRTPITVKTIKTEQLDGRDIVVIGYPDTHKPDDPKILAAVEDNPIFAVKRISQGTIFRHSTDTDTPYGVQVSVDEDDSTKFDMPAICHNASTLGGNSGSPILDTKTGELLGVHFAGFEIFNKQEAANLAMAIEQLASNENIKPIKT